MEKRCRMLRMKMGRKTSAYFKGMKIMRGRKEKEAEIEKEKEIRLMIWNVAGISKGGEEEWEYIQKFYMIGLTETWVREKDVDITRRKIKDYEVIAVPARKKKGKGKPKGGIILAWKKEVIEKIGETSQNEESIIGKFKIAEDIWTVGVTYMREKREENGKLIEK